MTNSTYRSAITATRLCKSYGDKVVLDGVDLDVRKGTIFVLLGPNGAGETAMVQSLATLTDADADADAARVGGHDLTRAPDAARDMIAVSGRFSTVGNLITCEITCEENLNLSGTSHYLGKATTTGTEGASCSAD